MAPVRDRAMGRDGGGEICQSESSESLINAIDRLSLSREPAASPGRLSVDK
jgi:hypothetical protein